MKNDLEHKLYLGFRGFMMRVPLGMATISKENHKLP